MYSLRTIDLDGVTIPVHHWRPHTEPKGLLFIFHGLAEHGLRYTELGKQLTEEGYEVFLPDLDVHGASVSSRDKLGIAGSNWFMQQIENMLALINQFRSHHPGKKIFLLGHSMGSFLAQRFVQLHGDAIDGLILSATNGKKDPLLGAWHHGQPGCK